MAKPPARLFKPAVGLAFLVPPVRKQLRTSFPAGAGFTFSPTSKGAPPLRSRQIAT